MAYNDKIIIQQSSVAADDYGERDATWTTYKTVWAEMDDSGGNLSYETDMPVFSNQRLFTIRTYDAPDVTTKMRISYDSDYYKILSVQKQGRMFTVLVAEANDDE